MKERHFLFRFLNVMNKESLRIQKIKQEEEKRRHSIRYGVGSLIHSAVMLGASTLIFAINAIPANSNPLLGFFLLLFLIIGAIILPLFAAGYSLSYAIVQLHLNKKPLGWIALVVFLLALVPTVLILVANIGK